MLLYAGLGALINDPHVTWRAVSEILPTALLVLFDRIATLFQLRAQELGQFFIVEGGALFDLAITDC